MKKITLTLLSLLLIFATLLVSCGDKPILDEIEPSAEDIKVVGTVGGKDILYDELRCLCLNYRELLANKYGDDIWDSEVTAAEHLPELESYVMSALKVNAAALITAERNGISIDSNEIKELVNLELNSFSEDLVNEIRVEKEDEEYSASRKEINTAYAEYLNDYHLTDRYNRYTLSVSACIQQLMQKFVSDGTVSNDDEYVQKYISDNFVRTLHVFIRNDTGESVDANRRLAEGCLDDLRSGRATMKQLIGSTVNDDHFLTTLNGYYFTRGEYFKEYEDAVYSLEIGEYSEVIASSDGFYIIQRLELESDYINKNFETLKSQYQTSYVNALIEDVKNEIEFVFNDYGKSLDLTKIK